MFGGCEIQQLRYFQKMQFSREAFVCNGCIFTAVFTIRMNGHGTGKMQRAFFKWNAVKDADIFLLACNEKWQQEKCQPFGHIVGHGKAQHPIIRDSIRCHRYTAAFGPQIHTGGKDHTADMHCFTMIKNNVGIAGGHGEQRLNCQQKIGQLPEMQLVQKLLKPGMQRLLADNSIQAGTGADGKIFRCIQCFAGLKRH